MLNKTKTIAFELRSAPEDSSLLSSKLGEFLDKSCVPESAKYDVMICCDEVFSNIYMHAYERRPDGRIEFSAEVSNGSVVVTFTHYGSALPAGKSIKLPADFSEGGYGLFIINELMDEVLTSRTGAANIITMKKYLA